MATAAKTAAWIGISALLVAGSALILVTGHLPFVGGVDSVVALILLAVAIAVLALVCRREPTVWKCVAPVVQWWSLDNAQLLASVAFPTAGAIAALAAVNFFYFEPQIPKPIVIPASYLDATKIPTIVDANVAFVIADIAGQMTQAALRSNPTSYKDSQALAEDCAIDDQDVNLLAPNACQATTGLPTVMYPQYLHALFASQHATARVNRIDYPELNSAQLQAASATLRDAAVQVDAATVINNGHIDATNVQMIIPMGLVPLDKDKDIASFSLAAGQTRTLLYTESADSSVRAGDTLPTSGFDVSTSTVNTVISQQLAWHLLLGAGAFLVLLVIGDMVRTRSHSGRRN